MHLRYLLGSIQDWPALIREAYRCTKPGGWVQSLDGDGRLECEQSTIKEHMAVKQWGEFFAEGGKRLNRVFNVIGSGVQRKSMEEAGFVDIVERDFKVGGTAPPYLSIGAKGRDNANYYRCRWGPGQRIRR